MRKNSETSDNIDNFFPTSYHQSRQRFRESLNLVREKWPGAELVHYLVDENNDLTIDWIAADPLLSKQNLVLISSGLHGVEGFVGSAMIEIFIREFLPDFDPNENGIVLVHTINPWGMEFKRRTNPGNVDLNRNFRGDQQNFSTEFNQNYGELNKILNPKTSLAGSWSELGNFVKNVLSSLKESGLTKLRGAVMLGQGSFPEGLYYCGGEFQPETLLMMDLIRQGFANFKSVIQIDLHTGYGPRYQMSLINSPLESRDTQILQEIYKYPRILRADPDEFYQMEGDMIDWAYHLQQRDFSELDYYGTAFEFGTLGSGILAEISSLRRMISENQIFFHGAREQGILNKQGVNFQELYYPSSKSWKTKALDDCRQAYRGIFTSKGLLVNSFHPEDETRN